MKSNKRILPVLLAVLMLFLPVAVHASDMPEVLTYTYTDAAPEVDAAQLFLAVYDGVCDISIEGERASFCFFYENIFRSTEKWRTFSSSVGVMPAADAADVISAEIAGALAGERAYFIDFRDGDVYPGTASVDVRVGDVADAADIPAAEQTGDAAQLRPIAGGLRLGEDGVLSLTMTEAHDYLLVVQSEQASAALTAYAYTPDYDAGGGFFAGANIGWIIFFVIVGLGLAGLVIYLVTVKVLMKRRRNQKKSLPAKKR